MDLAGFVYPPGVVQELAAEDHADFFVHIFFGEHEAMDVEPVMVDRLDFGGVKINAKVGELGALLQFASHDEARPGVDGF